MMLDVSRHFFNVAQVKQVIELLATYKLNTFHWHLVDGQGWRIQIKKYPKLTDVGGYRLQTMYGNNRDWPDSLSYGGFTHRMRSATW
jgi:hexosaminidase